jgi:tetratricopeptide (TPR) repeat protein
LQGLDALKQGRFERRRELDEEARKLYEQAVIYLKKFVEAYPGSRPGLLNLGLSHVHLEKYETAVPYLERAVRIRADPESLNLLARCYDKLGDGDLAVRLYRKSIGLRPAAETHYNLGVLHRRRGELPEAEKHLKRALELSPPANLVPRIKILLDLIQDHVSRSQDHRRHPLPQ